MFAFQPDLLIDTRNSCLVKPAGNESYVALSYVWGDALTLQTTTTNIQALQQHHALAQYMASSEVPKTVVHAIHLVKILEMRYLWVDALCIVQDDKIAKKSQIHNMPSMYSNAWLTIIAAEGNHANHGICGIRGVSESRFLPQQVFALPDQLQICEMPSSKLNETTWSKRGWTFQEYKFSRRRLIFGDTRVRWECRKHQLQEDVIAPMEADYGRLFISNSRLATLESLVNQSLPKLSSYINLIEDYNQRHFRYAKDANHAFAGICSVLLSSFEGGFLHGLPEMFFDDALLWLSRKCLERRINSIANQRDGPNTLLPSWSWMGWRGNINCSKWYSGSRFVKTGHGQVWMTSVQIISTLDWYTGCAGTDPTGWRNIFVSSRRYSSLINDSGSTTPPGWSRHTFNFEDLVDWEKKMWLEKKSCTTIFKLDSAPEAEFWYPIPIPPKTADKRALQPQTDCLYCRTSRAWLYVAFEAREELQKYNEEMQLGVSLRDKGGKWVGDLSVHADEDFQSLLNGTAPSVVDIISPQRAIELIEISRGYVHPDGKAVVILESSAKEGPIYHEVYEFYNVLWIEWTDGIAYRKGLGRVLRHVWESECEQGVDVILG